MGVCRDLLFFVLSWDGIRGVKVAAPGGGGMSCLRSFGRKVGYFTTGEGLGKEGLLGFFNVGFWVFGSGLGFGLL